MKTVENEANQIKCEIKLDEDYASKEIELLKKKGMLENEQEKKITELKILAEQVKNIYINSNLLKMKFRLKI